MKANSIGCDCRKKKKGDGCELWFYLFEVNKPGFCTMLEVGSGSVDGGERSVLSWPDTGAQGSSRCSVHAFCSLEGRRDKCAHNKNVHIYPFIAILSRSGLLEHRATESVALGQKRSLFKQTRRGSSFTCALVNKWTICNAAVQAAHTRKTNAE